MNISAISLIVEYKDLISLLFQVSSAAVFTVAQEVPAMANYLTPAVVHGDAHATFQKGLQNGLFVPRR